MICFAWDGFPQYAARCVGAFVKSTNEPVCVVATKPDVPVQGMEELAGCPVIWVGSDDLIDVEIPDVLIVSGWSIPAFNNFSNKVRAHGGKVVAMNDANYIFSFKEILRAIRFRLFLKHKFDAFFVPGKSGVRLMQFYGVPRKKIFTGMYSADASLFSDGMPLSERPKRIVYVGRFNARKNVLRLCEAFLKANGSEKGWTLALYGTGELKDQLPRHPAIEINDFVQPEELGAVYRNARCFALASLEEHWGLVVHEAALSGCVLLLSERVGAAADFVGLCNGVTFKPISVVDIAKAMKRVFEMDEQQLNCAQSESLQMAHGVNLISFIDGVNGLIEEMKESVALFMSPL